MHHPQAAQRKQDRQPSRVFGEPPVAHLGIAELLIDHSKRVLDLARTLASSFSKRSAKRPLSRVLSSEWCLPGRISTCQFTSRFLASSRLVIPSQPASANTSPSCPCSSAAACVTTLTLRCQIVILQQVPEAQDHGLVGQARRTGQADNLSIQRSVVQFFFHDTQPNQGANQ